MGKSYEIKLSYDFYEKGANPVKIKVFDPDGKIELKNIKLDKKHKTYEKNIDAELDSLNSESKLYQFRVREKQEPLYLTMTSFNWEFGDGTNSTLAELIHQYSAPFDYTVSVIIEYSTDDYVIEVATSTVFSVP